MCCCCCRSGAVAAVRTNAETERLNDVLRVDVPWWAVTPKNKNCHQQLTPSTKDSPHDQVENLPAITQKGNLPNFSSTKKINQSGQ